MPEYSVTFSRSAKKELQSLPLDIAARVMEKIELLVKNPRPYGYKKLRGHTGLFRIKVGHYRVIYSIDDIAHIVDISVVRDRNDAYR